MIRMLHRKTQLTTLYRCRFTATVRLWMLGSRESPLQLPVLKNESLFARRSHKHLGRPVALRRDLQYLHRCLWLVVAVKLAVAPTRIKQVADQHDTVHLQHPTTPFSHRPFQTVSALDISSGSSRFTSVVPVPQTLSLWLWLSAFRPVFAFCLDPPFCSVQNTKRRGHACGSRRPLVSGRIPQSLILFHPLLEYYAASVAPRLVWIDQWT